MQLRLVEPRGRVALDTVHEPFEGADANPVVSEPPRDAGVRQTAPLVERRTGKYTDGELAAALELREHRELERRRVVVNRRDAELRKVLLRRSRFPEALIERLGRDGGAHAGKRGIGHPTGCSPVHALEPRDWLRAREPSLLERDAVREPSRPIPAIEQ